MKKYCICLIFLLLAGLLCGCVGPDKNEPYDPLPYVYFLSGDTLQTLPPDAKEVKATLNNLSAYTVTTASTYLVHLEKGNTVTDVLSGTLTPRSLEAKSTIELTFSLNGAELIPGETYRVLMSVSYAGAGGEDKQGVVSFYFRCEQRQQPPQVTHDILTTPLSQLTEKEQEQLAQYLFRTYIPNSYGIYTDVSELSSASIWASVEELNAAVDNDTSEKSHTLAEVTKKVNVYYPGANFDPTKVRSYDPTTETFMTSPTGDGEKYVYLSYSVEGDVIFIVYEDDPSNTDQEIMQYRTALKNSATEGYFSFVSSVRLGAAG